jgi:hypothetical protein
MIIARTGYSGLPVRAGRADGRVGLTAYVHAEDILERELGSCDAPTPGAGVGSASGRALHQAGCNLPLVRLLRRIHRVPGRYRQLALITDEAGSATTNASSSRR